MFRDRQDAGRRLAARLAHLADAAPVVLGLPRGGVPVAAEVAAALHAPLDVILVRKLGVPHHQELAMGAIGEGDVLVVQEDVLRTAGLGPADVAAVERAERRELARQAARYRDGRPPLALDGRTAVVVDDGVATGATARAACQVARAAGALRVVLAVPVGSPRTLAALAAVADDVVSVIAPVGFYAVGEVYQDFSPTSDEEVVARLRSYQ